MTREKTGRQYSHSAQLGSRIRSSALLRFVRAKQRTTGMGEAAPITPERVEATRFAEQSGSRRLASRSLACDELY
jgi:hypothetical protein